MKVSAKKLDVPKKNIKLAHEQHGAAAAIAWTGGKDSTVILHLVRSLFGNTVPFPIFFNDSTMEFDEIYDFIDTYERDWRLDLTRIQHSDTELEEFRKGSLEKKKALSRNMKVASLQRALDEYGWKALLVGIRRDEHPARSKEKAVSKRDTHIRYHPVLDFTEDDIWAYIREFDVPYVSLYDKGYRSLGEKGVTRPAKKDGTERSGRDHDKELVMERLRSLEYY